MTSKFELAISTGYVPDWGITEAFRELFQNALDNEIQNPDNKMAWSYKNEVIRITNKTSKLTAESLLLGSSTKADDKNTIGKHGEGYKIAFMVLLRNKKKIKVYNYGANETWDVEFVKSKRYNGQMLTTIFVDKSPVWKKVPDNDLTIEVSGITEGEYRDIVQNNLYLREKPVKRFSMSGRGDIILDEEEKGNIYVKGLFVRNIQGLCYGYDFEPRVLGLDRDRKMVDSFNVTWESSILWQNACKESKEMSEIAVELVYSNASDVAYISTVDYVKSSVCNAVAKKFYDKHGNNAIPVTTNSEYDVVKKTEASKPVIVTKEQAKLIRESSISAEKVACEVISVQKKLKAFYERVEEKLTEDECDEFLELIEQVNN